MSALARIVVASSAFWVVARVTLLVSLGWSSAMIARREAAATRHLIWLCVIVGALCVPLIRTVAPIRLQMLPGESAAIEATVRSNERMVDPPSRTSQLNAISVISNPTFSEGRPTLLSRARTLAIYAWMVVVAGQLVWLMQVMRSVAGIVRRGRTLYSIDWTGALVDAAARTHVSKLPRLVASAEVETAFAVGLLDPVIVIPANAEEWSSDRRRAVLLHELAHVRRRDLVGHLLANVACAVYWFNPVVWAAARRLRVESEIAADDIVLASGVRPSEYAQHLLDIVTSLGQRAPVTAMAIARPTEFEGRLVAILDRSKRQPTVGLMRRRALVGVLGLLTFSIGAIAPAPRTRRVASVDASTTATRLNADIATRLHYGTAGIINPMLMLLSDADSLGLTEMQADSLATLNRSYMIGLSAIWAHVSNEYASSREAHDDISATNVFHEASRASINLLLRSVPSVNALLTASQHRRLPARIATYLDGDRLAAIGTGENGKMIDVFFPNGTVTGRPPRRPRSSPAPQ